MLLGKNKSFREQKNDALSIFHKAKKSLEAIGSKAKVRREDIAKQISSLSTEDSDVAKVISEIDGTLVDINSILRIDTVKEELKK